VGMMDISNFKSGGGGSSSEVAVHTGTMNVDASSSGGDGDSAGDALNSETAGHPSLPSVDAVSSAASRLINECPPFMTMSVRDSAPQLKLEDPPIDNKSDEKPTDSSINFQRRLIVKGGMKGYRMSRATHGATSGCYYYEAVILGSDESSDSSNAGRGLKRPLQEVEETLKENETGSSSAEKGTTQQKQKASMTMNGHLRIGWSTRSADLQAPVGYNEHSYAIRDTMGSRIHKSRREDKWGGDGFGPGDVMGLAICLVNNKTTNSNTTTSTSLGSASIGMENNKTESVQNLDTDDAGKSSTLTNHIRFFKNGQPMGEDGMAFDNINPGTYHPAVSCYMDGSAQINFGPHFVYPPHGLPSEINLHPISELCTSPPVPEETTEQIISGGSGSSKEGGKKIFFSKRTDDSIVSAFKELVRTEATARHEAFLKHLDLHRGEISAFRMERGLSTVDLVESLQQQQPQSS